VADGSVECRGERGDVKRGDGNRVRSRGGVRDHPAPEELIAERRHHDSGQTGAQTCGRGPRSLVMTDGATAREQPVMLECSLFRLLTVGT